MELHLINFPMKYGCNVSGADQAFEPLHHSGWIQDHVNKVHHIPIQNIETQFTDDKFIIMNAAHHHQHVVETIYKQHHFPISFGGDHTTGLGGVSACLNHFNDDVTILWIDAHADSHTTESSPSNNIHGMPCAILQGLCSQPLTMEGTQLKPNQLVYLGLNCYEMFEINHLQSQNIAHLKLHDLQHLSTQQMLQWLSSHIKTKYIYISFDFDVLSSDDVFAVNVNADEQYASHEGLALSQALDCLSFLLSHYQCVGCDFVEYNPTLDHHGRDFNHVIKILSHVVTLIKEHPYDSTTI